MTAATDAAPPLAYSISGAAQAIGVSRQTLYTLIGSGALQARMLGGRTIVLATDLNEFLRNLPIGLHEPRNPKHDRSH